MQKYLVLTVLAMVATLAIVQQMSAHDAKSKDAKSADALLMKAQKICPVTGDKFDHGEALKTKIEGAVMFLCCEDCKDKAADKAHMAKITANLIAAQQKCPVMGKALPKDAPSVVVEGRRLFVCCKPCIKKIEGDPKKYIAKADSLLAENLKEKKDEPKRK